MALSLSALHRHLLINFHRLYSLDCRGVVTVFVGGFGRGSIIAPVALRLDSIVKIKKQDIQSIILQSTVISNFLNLWLIYNWNIQGKRHM